MGTDIGGHIECRLRDRASRARDPEFVWRAAIDLDLLYEGRDYDAFGCLFGVRNYANFRPIAGGRGFPKDVSTQVLTRAGKWDSHDPTWVTWAEIAAVNWDEMAPSADQRVHCYRRGPDGSLTYDHKSGWSPKLAAATGYTLDDITSGLIVFREGQEWADGDLVFRAERMSRRDAVPPDGAWWRVWMTMETLADMHGSGNVRLIVWFG